MKTSWPIKNLGGVCDVLDKLRKPITRRDREPGPYPYYGATGIQDHVADYIFDEDLILVGEDGARWEAGDNSAYKISGKSWVNNHAHVLRPHRDVIHEDWLTYYLNTSDLSEYITGTTVKKLNQAKLRSIGIPLPSLEEQKKIVAKLEKLLAKVSEAKKLRTEAQETARQLLPAELHKFLEEGERKGWKNILLGDVVNSFQYGSSKKALGSGVVPCLRMGNIQDGEIDWSSLKYASKDEEVEKYALNVGDVLFNRTNSPKLVGKTAIFRGKQPAIFAGYLIRINHDKTKISGEFLNYCLNSGLAKDFCLRVKTDGVSQSNINAKKLATFSFPLPSLIEQEAIVKKLNAISQKTKKIQDYQDSAHDDLLRLQQSILSKAFQGKLL